MKRLSKKRLLTLVLSGFSLHVYSSPQHDVQTWLNTTITGDVAKQNSQFNRVKYWLEGQERVGDDITRCSQTLARGALGYALKTNLSLWAGYAWIHTGVPYTYTPFTEDRIWEQLLWTTKVQQSTFTSRTRLEQRFLANSNRTAYRARQLVKLSSPLAAHPKFSLVMYDEWFWHKNDFIGRNGQGFDQNRFFVGIGYQFNKSTSLEVGYLNQYIRRFGVPNFLANALSIALYVNS